RPLMSLTTGLLLFLPGLVAVELSQELVPLLRLLVLMGLFSNPSSPEKRPPGGCTNPSPAASSSPAGCTSPSSSSSPGKYAVDPSTATPWYNSISISKYSGLPN